MPGKPDKQHRIRVRTLDGRPRDGKELNKLKSNQLGMPHLDIVGTRIANEFIICAGKDTHIEQVRLKLQGAGLEVIDAGDTTIAAPRPTQQQRSSEGSRGGQHQQQSRSTAPATNVPDLSKKPYGFVALPEELTTTSSIWHDGTSSKGRLSGEVRFELETLTPLLVGWERGQVGDTENDWPLPANLADVGRLADKKSVLCPLRAPWGTRPVIIPGDSLKGLLRHELGALLGAPMERVAERSYSYRPNALFPKDAGPFLEARIAWVPQGGFEERPLDPSNPSGPTIRVPVRLELLPKLTYDRDQRGRPNTYCFDPPNNQGDRYLGGQGAGDPLNSKKRPLHRKMGINRNAPNVPVEVPEVVQAGYVNTVRHLIDLDHGHFASRHPDIITKTILSDEARNRILKAAKDEVFQPGDLVWVEWDTEKKCIVSLGWHYYYRWAYTDTVRKDADAPQLERHGLFPLNAERQLDGTDEDKHRPPQQLSLVRRLFGYAIDKENPGVAGIGKGDHTQLMGRVFVNAGLEVVGEKESVDDPARFLPPTFLKELGMPRPSAVEHYLKQPHHPQSRPSDKATLVTYGDASGYDTPGELAGRKFYLNRKDAYGTDGKGLVPGPAADDSHTNRQNDRSTLALEASKPGRKFRFTVRFRDLDASELAAVLVALCPDQFKGVLGGTHAAGYCSKLGYARPLGWGSVRIDADSLLFLDEFSDNPTLKPEANLDAWVKNNHQKTATQDEWLAIHRRNHPDAADYPTKDGQIYTYHTGLRADHSRYRRYKKDGSR